VIATPKAFAAGIALVQLEVAVFRIQLGDRAETRSGLFPTGTIPSPSLELFTKNLGSWEQVHAGAQDVKEQLS
jgi:hypothetical protein